MTSGSWLLVVLVYYRSTGQTYKKVTFHNSTKSQLAKSPLSKSALDIPQKVSHVLYIHKYNYTAIALHVHRKNIIPVMRKNDVQRDASYNVTQTLR